MALTHKQAIDWILNSVGKYYNPDGAYGYQCLTEKSRILNKDGKYVSPKDLKVGDKVLSELQEQNEVIKNEPIESEVYEIKTSIGSFVASYDHLVKKINGAFEEVKNLKAGDELALANLSGELHSELTDSELRFLGFWLGDGTKAYRWKNSTTPQIYLTVGVQNKYDYIESLGLDLNTYNHSNKTAKLYHLVNKSHPRLAYMIHKIQDKQLFPFFTKEESKLIIEGYLQADGSLKTDHSGSYSSTNREMVVALHQLAIHAGIKFTLNPEKEREATNYSDNPKPITLGAWNLNKKASGKVLSIKKLPEKQTVYALELSGDKTYIADGFIHHNCKDYADAYAIALFGDWANTLRPNNAKDVFDGANPAFFDKIRNNPNDPNQIPQAGDIIVYGAWRTNPYGHIEVVLDANNSGAMVVYQDGFAQIPATKLFRAYTQLPIIGWLRPKYQAEAETVDKSFKKVSAEVGVNVRNEPNTQSGIFATYPQNSEIQMKGFCEGENVNGSNIWLVSARSAKFLHSSAFENATDGLNHLPEYDKKVAENKQEVQPKPVEKPVEYHAFEKQFDFVDEVQPVAVSNQFYGRKNLKGEDGKYYSAIPDDYASQKAFVEQLDKPTAKIVEITVHNTANNSIESTLNEFRRKDSFKSAHLVVSNSKIVQCVEKENTAFTNGKHESNIESFTIEFLDDVSDERYVEVLKKVKQALGVEKIGKHRDHSVTACPAKLSDDRFNQIIQKINIKSIENHIPEAGKKVEDINNPIIKEKNIPKAQIKKQEFTEKNMAQIEDLNKQAREVSDSVEYTPVIPESVKNKTYFATGSLLILTTLISSVLMALIPEKAIFILAIAGALNTAYAGINQLFKISSKK